MSYFFLPGLKIDFYLKVFKDYLPNRNILIAREITKIHETFYRGEVNSIEYFKKTLKGEITVVISKKNNKDQISDSQIKDMAKILIKKNSLKDVANKIYLKEGVAKKRIYNICLQIKK